MRIGIWNLERAPNSNWPRGRQMLGLARECDADLWLFTEVHIDRMLPEYAAVTSEPRSGAPARKRWSGIACRDTFELTAIPIVEPGPADEGLCLARITTTDRRLPNLLVACSVLPWANTSSSWPSLHAPGHLAGFADRFRCVADAHAERIATVRQADEVVLWGGDFNQSLTGRIMGSGANRSALVSALETLDLIALTADARHLLDGACSIDHVAVSSEWPGSSGVTVITRSEDTRQTSDHALYLVDVDPRSETIPRAGHPA